MWKYYLLLFKTKIFIVWKLSLNLCWNYLVILDNNIVTLLKNRTTYAVPVLKNRATYAVPVLLWNMERIHQFWLRMSYDREQEHSNLRGLYIDICMYIYEYITYIMNKCNYGLIPINLVSTHCWEHNDINFIHVVLNSKLDSTF